MKKSGNPNPSPENRFTSENQPKNKGAKKGSKNKRTILRDLFDKVVQKRNPLNGELEGNEIEYFMHAQQIQNALDGDLNAYKYLLDLMYGANENKVDITTNGNELKTPQFTWANQIDNTQSDIPTDNEDK